MSLALPTLCLAVCVMLSVAFVATPAHAQWQGTSSPSLIGIQAQPGLAGSGPGLLDTSRFGFNHSLSFNYASGSAGDVGFGLWQGRLGYQLSKPLRISVDVGAVLNTTGPGPMLSEQSFYLGGFNLDYAPSESFRIHVAYVNTPSAAVMPYRQPGSFAGLDWGNPAGFGASGTNWMSGSRR